MLRRLHPEQPESFAFTPANKAWAEAQITKYPEGRQASAVIPATDTGTIPAATISHSASQKTRTSAVRANA